jgi:hypothetical protein
MEAGVAEQVCSIEEVMDLLNRGASIAAEIENPDSLSGSLGTGLCSGINTGVCPMQSSCLESTEDMITQEERIKGLETQARTAGERLAKVEGKLEIPPQAPKTTHPLIICIVGAVCAALVAYLAWIGIKVVSHETKLDEIILLVAPEKLNQAASQPAKPEDIKAAKQILAIAKKNGTKLERPVVSDTGMKFVSAAETHPESWDTALAFLDYRSFLNEGSLPVGDAEFSKISGELVSNFEISTKGPLTVTFSWANQTVPVDQSFLYQRIEKPINRQVGHQYLLVNKQKGIGSMALDGFRLRNVIFDGIRISYDGGPLILQNVSFINCTFEINRGPLGIALAKALLSPDSAIGFNAS